MSEYYSLMNEPYVRFFHRARDLAKLVPREQRRIIDGRTLPTAIRQDEVLRLPPYSKSKQWLTYVLAVFIYVEENDYALSTVINHVLRMASRYSYEGSWEIWGQLAEFFELEIVQGTEKAKSYREVWSSSAPNGTIGRLSNYERSLPARKFGREGTIFDFQSFMEFLQLHFSLDDLFGNYLPAAVALGRIIKFENNEQQRLRRERRAVKRKIRHRGYRDKGSLPDRDAQIRREANRESEPQEKEVLYDSSSQIIDWGQKPPPK